MKQENNREIHGAMMINQTVNWQINVAGDGLWSNQSALVRIIRVEADVHEPGEWGELRAYFDARTWDVDSQGLIYTDTRWIQEFRAMMKTLGFSPMAVEDISYSEQGMQGNDYVSMDVSEAFLREAEPMYRWAINKMAVNNLA